MALSWSTTRRRPRPRPSATVPRMLAYVISVGVAAATLATLAATVPGRDRLGPAYLAVFAGMIALAETLQIRYIRHEAIGGLTLVESLFAPLLVCTAGVDTVVVVAAGVGFAALIRRDGLVRGSLTVAQRVASVSVGVLVIRGGSGQPVATTASVVVLLAALASVWLVDQLLVIGILWVSGADSADGDSERVLLSVLLGRLGSLAASSVVGVLLTAAYLWVPWTVTLAMALLVVLWAAGRAEALLRADRRRLDGLHRATHHLVVSHDVCEVLPETLAEACRGFSADVAELILLDPDDLPQVHRSTSNGDYTFTEGPHPLAERLADSLIGPVLLEAPPELPAPSNRSGRARVLAAPLVSADRVLGMLLLHDDSGIEGFESGTAVAGALARELAGFLQRVELVRAIEAQRRALADIVDHTGDGILTVDCDGTVLSWNAAMSTMTGYAGSDIVGTHGLDRLDPRDSAGTVAPLARWNRQHDDLSLPNEVQIRAADGSVVWLSCSYSRVPARDSRGEALVTIARNVTHAREFELLKDDFVAVVSHELRTPLVPIKGWAQTLLSRGDRLTDDQRRIAAQSILRESQRLESLVLNILESSRVEVRQGDAPAVVDVFAIVGRVVEDVMEVRPDRRVRVLPPPISCDVQGSAVWIERIVSNLIANAVKYSPKPEPIDVGVDTDHGDVIVTVTDRGPGIPAEDQERIFARFERLAATQTQTGTGLGLYITRRLARGMGGDVTVESTPGAGSTFSLRLPAAVRASTSDDVPQPREGYPSPEADSDNGSLAASVPTMEP
jgi:PAS domain S-box-containing protein